ncbi:MAG: hypothetical protein M3Z24_03100, partial [Chloroflexota bacterium]|nr:hypothetical protein [Chloroflexota bacterium]
MNKSAEAELTNFRRGTEPRTGLPSLRPYLTPSNLIGGIGAVCALACLLVLHEPWNIRIPLYLVLALWVLLQPRAALYLTAFAVPWGSLDAITIGGSSVNSADILVGLLVASWLVSFTLRSHGILRKDLNDYGHVN